MGSPFFINGGGKVRIKLGYGRNAMPCGVKVTISLVK